MHWEKSYQFGKMKEQIIYPILLEFFKRTIEKMDGRFAKYDYRDKDNNYELKSRTFEINKYPTTMITKNKLESDKQLILLFNFTDCLAYIIYDEEKFKNYETKMFSRAYKKSDEKEHIYIPISDLTIIKKYL
jgi:hypothetical protein